MAIGATKDLVLGSVNPASVVTNATASTDPAPTTSMSSTVHAGELTTIYL